MRMGAWIGLAACVLGQTTGAAAAQSIHGVDFVLRISEDDRLETGAVVGGDVVYPNRINVGEFGETGVANFTGNPGVDSEPGNLIPGMEVGFDLVAPTMVWDGSAFVATSDVITVRKSFVNYETPANDGEVTPGPVFGDANNDPAAVFHHHVQFFRNFGSTAADDGVWLFAWELWTPEAGIDRSETLYVVFFQGAGEGDVTDAVAWVEANLLADPCPADLNGDGFLNNTDINLFVNAFLASDTSADFNGDGFFNNTDINLFVNAFLAGCGG